MNMLSSKGFQIGTALREASRISGLDPKGETEGAAVPAAGEGAKMSRPAVGKAGAADVGREAGPGE